MKKGVARKIIVLGIIMLFVGTGITITPDMFVKTVKADPGTITITPSSQDSYVTWLDGHEDKNYGTQTSMNVASNLPNGATCFSYVKFDLSSIPQNSIIDSATLKLFCEGIVPSSPGDVYIYEVKGNWDENTVTWNTGSNPHLSPAAKTYVSSIGWQTWDVTQHVKDWYTGYRTNYGFMVIRDLKSHHFSVYTTKEGVITDRPKLEVSYSPAPAYPDLNITDISWIPENPKSTDTIEITVDIINKGGQMQRGCTLLIRVDNQDYYQTIMALAYNTREEGEIHISLPRGPHTIYAYFDYYNDIYESNENNNERTKSLTVGNSPPNNPEKPIGSTTGIVGDTFTYSFRAFDPDSDQLNYSIDWGDGSDLEKIGPFPSGQSVQFSHRWTGPGQYKVKAYVKDVPYELGSQYSQELLVFISGTGYIPNVEDGEISDDGGYTTTFFKYFVSYADKDNDPPESISVYIDDIPYEMTLLSGEPANGRYIFPASGDGISLPADWHTFYFNATDGKDGWDRDPDIGYYTGPYVGENNNPVLSSPSVSPIAGDINTEFCFTIHYFDPDGNAPSIKHIFIDNAVHTMSLVSGSASNGIYEFKQSGLTIRIHSYRFQFRDGRGGFAESPSSGDHPGPEVGPPKPNLVIKEITWTPEHPLTGDLVKFTVRIQNIGGADAVGTFDNEFWIGDQKYEWSKDGLGRFITHFQEFEVMLTTGTIQLHAITDVNNDIPEVIETDNERFVSIGVEGKPDLIISDITWEPLNLRAGETIKFSIDVQNIGDRYINNSFQNYLCITNSQGEIVQSDTWTVYWLMQGMIKTHQFETTLPTGDYIIHATADYQNMIPNEANEDNNNLEKYLRVGISTDLKEIINEVDSLRNSVLDKIDADINSCPETLTKITKKIWTEEAVPNYLLEMIKFAAGHTNPLGATLYWGNYFIDQTLKSRIENINSELIKKVLNTYGNFDFYNDYIIDDNEEIVSFTISDIDNDNQYLNELILSVKDIMDIYPKNIRVYRFNNGGYFEQYIELESLEDIISFYVSDITNDGLNELLVQTRNQDGDKITAYQDAVNIQGHHYFSDIARRQTSQNIFSISIADADNDESLPKELVVAFEDEFEEVNHIVFYRYNGAGTFESARYKDNDNFIPDLIEENNILSLIVGDSDNNNHNEIILVTENYISTHRYSALSNQWIKDIDNIETSETSGSNPMIADANNDGLNELIIKFGSGPLSRRIDVYQYDGIRKYDKLQDLSVNDPALQSFTVADSDNDNKYELILHTKYIGHFIVTYRTNSIMNSFIKDENEIFSSSVISNFLISDITNNGLNDLVINFGTHISCYHYESNSETIENYLKEQFNEKIKNSKIPQNMIEEAPKISEVKNLINDKYDYFISELNIKYPDGLLPDNFPKEDVISYIRDLKTNIELSQLYQTTIMIWDHDIKNKWPLKIGFIGTSASHVNSLIYLLNFENTAIKAWDGGLEFIGTYKDIFEKTYGIVRNVGFIKTPLEGVPVLGKYLPLFGTPLSLGMLLTKPLYIKLITEGEVKIKYELARDAADTQINIFHEIYCSYSALKQTEEYVLNPPDMLEGRILSVDMPDIVLNKGEDIGVGQGHISVENLMKDKQIDVVINVRAYGPINYGKPEILFVVPEESTTIEPATTLDIPFEYSVVGTEIWDSCEQYEAIVIVVFNGNVVKYNQPIYFSVGSQDAVNAANTQNTNEIMNGQINERQYYYLPYQPSSGTKNVEFSLQYGGSDLDIQVYDSTGNHVGLNYATNEIDNEIPNSSYSGPDRNPEWINIKPIPDETYIIKVYAKDADDNETFFVTATESPEYPPLLALIPSKIEINTSPSEIEETEIFIHEYGGQKKLENISISVSDLSDGMGHIIPTSAVTFKMPQNTTEAGTSLQVNISFTCPETMQGLYTGTITATANNNTTSDTGIIKILITSDNNPPVTNKTIGNPNYGADEEWITSNTEINLTATDDNSGVAFTYYRIWLDNIWTNWFENADNFTLSGEGKHYLEYYSVDYAGNVEEIHNQTHYVDNTSPVTIKAIGTPKYGTNNQWVASSTQFSLTANDYMVGAGVNITKYRIWTNSGWTPWMTYTMNFTLSGQGIHYLEYYSIDNLGNTETIHNQTHYVDDSLPVVTISASPNSLWPPNHKMKNVLISGSATDAESGIASITFTVDDEYNLVEPTLTGFGQTIQLEAWRNGNDMDGRTYIITATATDNLGHVTTTSTIVRVPHDQGN